MLQQIPVSVECHFPVQDIQAQGTYSSHHGLQEDQGDLWCDDLCVAIIKTKEKEMTLIDANANMSW
jgi:hypothetical protein